MNIVIAISSHFKDAYEPNALVKALNQRGHTAYLWYVDHTKILFDKDEIILETNISLEPDKWDVLFIREIFGINMTTLQLVSYLIKRYPDLYVIDNGLLSDYSLIGKVRQLLFFKNAGIPVPKSMYFISTKELANSYHLISKQLNLPFLLKHTGAGKGGMIFKITNKDEFYNVINTYTEGVDSKKSCKFYAQEFLKLKADYRVLVIEENVLGAMQRIPAKGEFRANFSLGGKVKPAVLTPTLKELATKAKKVLGYDFGGVDIVIDEKGNHYVLEVNRIPGFEGFSKAFNIDVASIFAEYIERKVRGNKTI